MEDRVQNRITALKCNSVATRMPRAPRYERREFEDEARVFHDEDFGRFSESDSSERKPEK